MPNLRVPEITINSPSLGIINYAQTRTNNSKRPPLVIHQPWYWSGPKAGYCFIVNPRNDGNGQEISEKKYVGIRCQLVCLPTEVLLLFWLDRHFCSRRQPDINIRSLTPHQSKNGRRWGFLWIRRLERFLIQRWSYRIRRLEIAPSMTSRPFVTSSNLPRFEKFPLRMPSARRLSVKPDGNRTHRYWLFLSWTWKTEKLDWTNSCKGSALARLALTDSTTVFPLAY